MNKFVFVICTLLTASAIAKKDEFYSFKDCAGFENSKIVENIEVQFTSIPKTGEKC